MRILHVTPYFEDAWAYGGIPRAVAATVRGLAARGHEVTVCTTDAFQADARLPASPAAAATPPPVDVRVFPNLSNLAAYHLQFFLPRGLRDYLRYHAQDFDVAHLHGCHHLPGALAARYLRRAGVPYVVTPHGTAAYLERRQTAKRLFDATVGRGLLTGARLVVAVSAAERRQLMDLGVPPANLTVIANPLDTREFEHPVRGAFRQRLGLGAAARLVLYLGKLTPRKRVDILVGAFAQLRDPECRLAIAGNDMGYGATLRRLVERLGVADRVVFTGLVPGAQRVSALADADVVSYASQHEVFGLVAVEALLCGTPVVVADDSGCGEIVRETGGGLLVPPGDEDALRYALETILASPVDWRRSARVAGERARRFSSDVVCSEIERVYRQFVPSAGHTVQASAV